MPSVLAEISFLTNRQELQLLKTAAYKDKIAAGRCYDAVAEVPPLAQGHGGSALTVEPLSLYTFEEIVLVRRALR